MKFLGQCHIFVSVATLNREKNKHKYWIKLSTLFVPKKSRINDLLILKDNFLSCSTSYFQKLHRSIRRTYSFKIEFPIFPKFLEYDWLFKFLFNKLNDHILFSLFLVL